MYYKIVVSKTAGMERSLGQWNWFEYPETDLQVCYQLIFDMGQEVWIGTRKVYSPSGVGKAG